MPALVRVGLELAPILVPYRCGMFDFRCFSARLDNASFCSPTCSSEFTGVGNSCQFSIFQLIMDVVSRCISLTAWGRLYGFDKASTARSHHAGKLPLEFQIEQPPNGRYYVVVPRGKRWTLCGVRSSFVR